MCDDLNYNLLDIAGNSTLFSRLNRSNLAPLQSIPDTHVLYLPTVALRSKHNPAFAFACSVANRLKAPLIVLAVVLDDSHLVACSNCSPQDPDKPIVFTARRVALVLEALQQASVEWERHGAGVAIRVHGQGCRWPHHVILASSAAAVVSDEPFVHPYLSFVQSVERACIRSNVPMYRVDGSTTVPPMSLLPKKSDGTRKAPPEKAWRWEKTTDPYRKKQVNGVVENGHFNAPALLTKLSPNICVDTKLAQETNLKLPKDWLRDDTSEPGKKPWTPSQLASINVKSWVNDWPGVDKTVPPATQTNGSRLSGEQRWKMFQKNSLAKYHLLRNDITKPHAVSRISCYLNIGSISIFQVVHDIWQHTTSKSRGVDKFVEEIIKWREIGYAHSFSFPDSYNRSESIPAWARVYLDGCFNNSAKQSLTGGRGREDLTSTFFTLEQLESCNTSDKTWNAMQRYLNDTGELHNNARMTWGKTVVHWGKYKYKVDYLIRQLIYLNDRYALDGLSPPSYSGLLWCMGWGDKPATGSKISQKSASRYKRGPSSFDEGRRALLRSIDAERITVASFFPSSRHNKKRRRKEETEV